MAKWTSLIGLEPNKTGHLEKWLSLGGGLAGVLAVVWISRHFVDPQGTAGVAASVGASAVLLFAVPHGPMSQPWPVLGGHVTSALIGVACATWIPDLMVAAPVAVALSIGAMHYLRCIHPPGGATALTAVVGGDSLRALGFQYVVTPVLLDALVLLAIAILFNGLFAWRRYPAALASPRAKSASAHPVAKNEDHLSRRELEAAVRGLSHRAAGDHTGCDLQELYHLLELQRDATSMAPDDIQAGRCYSNGLHGPLWQIRRVTAKKHSTDSGAVQVEFNVVAGAERRATGSTASDVFARWAKYEVFLNENSWQRVDYTETAA
ncbi:MAG: HPP family protein [Gammaproteobacteria bacterium]|nr:HPP family protein [Gammaproteobacteria bacterium]